MTKNHIKAVYIYNIQLFQLVAILAWLLLSKYSMQTAYNRVTLIGEN